jgi:endonuclease/exonuclease/phosphatase family metal-dependent hydrolase
MRKKNIKSVFVLILAAFLTGCAHLWAEPETVERETAGEVRVMSWNILYRGWEKEGHASWKERIPGSVQILQKHQPDVVGLQEDSKQQVAYLTRALPDYSYLDPYKKKGGGLLIRTEAWQVIKSGKIPIPGKRHASWALLESTQNGECWLFYNAHFIHRSAKNSAADRMTAAKQIAAHIAQHAPADVSVVFTGDFNALHDMPCMRYLAGDAGAPVQFSNAFNLIHGGDDPRGTFRGLSNAHHCDRIDHILTNEHVTVQNAEIIYYDDELAVAYPSDHYPVQATLRRTAR